LSFEEALSIVEARGQYMHEACEANPGVMYVVLGLNLEVVEKVVAPIGEVWVANLNCPRQIVISGTPEGVEAAAVQLKEAGARRVMPLDVSGAFHSGLMQSAQDRLEPMIQEASLSPSNIDIVMNIPGNFTPDLNEMRENMIQQITRPVLWQKGIEAILDRKIALFIEMGPGKTLAGINKRIGMTLPTISIENVKDFQGVSHYATFS
jgi:[acyl-carrier-protein] S-malonyltransferase